MASYPEASTARSAPNDIQHPPRKRATSGMHGQLSSKDMELIDGPDSAKPQSRATASDDSIAAAAARAIEIRERRFGPEFITYCERAMHANCMAVEITNLAHLIACYAGAAAVAYTYVNGFWHLFQKNRLGWANTFRHRTIILVRTAQLLDRKGENVRPFFFSAGPRACSVRHWQRSDPDAFQEAHRELGRTTCSVHCRYLRGKGIPKKERECSIGGLLRGSISIHFKMNVLSTRVLDQPLKNRRRFNSAFNKTMSAFAFVIMEAFSCALRKRYGMTCEQSENQLLHRHQQGISHAPHLVHKSVRDVFESRIAVLTKREGQMVAHAQQLPKVNRALSWLEFQISHQIDGLANRVLRSNEEQRSSWP